MIYREAKLEDIKQIFEVRFSVSENKLSPDDHITEQVCKEYLFVRGKGWVCQESNQVLGFAIADLEGKSVWALFIRPEFENKGIGRNLYNLMTDWYFSQTHDTIWLVTESHTRAELFYRKSGWKEIAIPKVGEIRFELTYDRWKEFKEKITAQHRPQE